MIRMEIAMIHYASIVERQLRDGRRRSSRSTPARTPWDRGESSALRTAPTRPQGQSTQPVRRFEQSAPQPNRRPEYNSSTPNRNNQNRTVQPNQSQHGTPGRARDVQCHKCRVGDTSKHSVRIVEFSSFQSRMSWNQPVKRNSMKQMQ